MPKNMSLGSNRVDQVRSLQKIMVQLYCTKFALKAPFQPFCTKVRAITERSETTQNMSLGSNRVDRVHSLRKIPTRLRCSNLGIKGTYSAHFASKFMQ
jgi:hypothetical protein